jgi:hypothetical protein
VDDRHWPDDVSARAAPAQALGSYRLVERLGQGGMGEVWRAKHQLLARPAAIKLLQPTLGQGADAESALRRFEREAQVTSQLRSPHTVELWDFGVAGDGRFYYVMELLDGLDLDTLVKRHGPLPAERVIHLLRQIRVVPGQGSDQASAVCQRAVAPPGRDPGTAAVDGGARVRPVGASRTGGSEGHRDASSVDTSAKGFSAGPEITSPSMVKRDP